MTNRDSTECGCAVVGPLLTAPGTSGRTWVCDSCGRKWEPDQEAHTAESAQKEMGE